jgi:glutamate-ammonia-ligase adenylyltransferase
VLFDTDLALRPSGNSGLMVSSLEAFERYQERDAWVWEHQALTAARYSAGDARVGSAFESLRERILRRRRDRPSSPPRSRTCAPRCTRAPQPLGLFDLKHDTGG